MPTTIPQRGLQAEDSSSIIEVMRETDLYPIIRNQWKGGVVVRIDSPSRPGISDLVLVRRLTIFAEVKLALTLREKLYITAPQVRFIQEVTKVGGFACAVAFVMENRQWYLFDSNLLGREWPTVRPAMGSVLGRDLGTLEAKILSISRQTGQPFGAQPSNVTTTVASNAETMSREKGKPGSTISSL